MILDSMTTQSKSLVSTPLVSVIIPTYNQEDTIRQTLDSILNQKTDYEYEIIIGEDFGSDKTREICKQYVEQYDYVFMPDRSQNLGIVANWLDCISYARGEYLMGCAGDDYWHNENKIQLQVDYMKEHLNCGVVHTDCDVLYHNKRLVKNVLKNKSLPQGMVYTELFHDKFNIVAPTTCIRKCFFDKHIPKEKYIELKFPVEDWPTWIILSHYSEINYLPVSTITYRKGHESLSNLQSYDKVINKYTKEKIMYKFLCDMFPDTKPYDENSYDIYINNILLNLSYKKFDYQSAKMYGENYFQLTNNRGNDKKARFSKNPMLFLIFALLKKIRQQ